MEQHETLLTLSNVTNKPNDKNQQLSYTIYSTTFVLCYEYYDITQTSEWKAFVLGAIQFLYVPNTHAQYIRFLM